MPGRHCAYRTGLTVRITGRVGGRHHQHHRPEFLEVAVADHVPGLALPIRGAYLRVLPPFPERKNISFQETAAEKGTWLMGVPAETRESGHRVGVAAQYDMPQKRTRKIPQNPRTPQRYGTQGGPRIQVHPQSLQAASLVGAQHGRVMPGAHPRCRARSAVKTQPARQARNCSHTRPDASLGSTASEPTPGSQRHDHYHPAAGPPVRRRHRP